MASRARPRGTSQPAARRATMPENQRKFELLFPTVMQMTMVADHEALNAELLREIE